MTDLDLQDALVQEIKDFLKDNKAQMMKNNIWREYNVYKHDRPYKDEEHPEQQEDYIVIMIDDEDTDDDGKWIVQIQFIVGITYFDEDNQGNGIVANLLNEIYFHLKSKGIIDQKYEMETKAHKRFNQDHFQGIHEGGLITYWKLPEVKMEGLEEFL